MMKISHAARGPENKQVAQIIATVTHGCKRQTAIINAALQPELSTAK
ncbi:hypothetical protein [Rhodopseudomonas palustris]